jgi:hypothetical protein
LVRPGEVGEGDPAADALGEEGVAVGRVLSYHVVQLAEELERDDAEQVRPHHQRALDEGGGDARGQVVIDDFTRAAGAGQVRVSEIPSVVLRGMGLAWPLMRELRETEYQFREDFVMDSTAAQASFGLKPTPWDEIVAVTAGSR